MMTVDSNTSTEHSIHMARRSDSVALVVDVQARLMPAISNREALVERLRVFLPAMKILRVPIIYTEQYPQGLGETIPEIKDLLGSALMFPKMSFSCFGDERFVQRLEGLGRRTILLCGVETHVCVMQTALHGLRKGYRIHVLEDIVGSRRDDDKQLGLGRMRDSGCVISRAEMAIFELLGRAGSVEFKEILPLLK
jgi:nicotinamidase-related amidase